MTQVTQAISLATKAGDSTLNASDLSAIAGQVSDLRDSVVSLANTSYGGTYLFSGSQGTTKPFSLDSSTDPATVAYHGDAVTQSIQTSQGQNIAIDITGGVTFQNSGGDLLGALNQLVSQLNAGDTSGIASATAALTAGLGQLSSQRAALGNSLSALTAASGYAGTQEAQVKAQQSTLLSADPAQVATDLQTTEVQHQALLSVIASLGKTDLFDYLQ